jgi:phospholipase C
MTLITNVVVVMLENRSYDNVLGWLYGAGNSSPYAVPPAGQSGLNGLTGNESNPNPYDADLPLFVINQPATQIGGHGQTYPGTAIPAIDPGETFHDMAQQFLGLHGVPRKDPYKGYSPEAWGLMQGFLYSYKLAGKDMTANNIQDVMNYLTPAQMPVTSFLANQFGVCDQWFASVPTQTFTNRLFAFSAAPAVIENAIGGLHSIVDDDNYPFGLESLLPHSSVVQLPTVCSRLDDVFSQRNAAGPNWKVYFHDYSIAVMTIPYIAGAAQSASNVNVSTFDNSDWGDRLPKQLASLPPTFVSDVTSGNLPPFSFIEPRYSKNFAPNHLPVNSNHPGPGNYGIFTKSEPSDAPIDAAGGELLLMQVYNLLRQSSSWSSTLLVVTYDEHGGNFDHVPPPLATPPGTVHLDGPPPLPSIPTARSDFDSAANGFDYTLLGGRVPAIVISPNILSGSTVRTESAFDHTSIIRTLWDAFELSGDGWTSLTARDAAAPSLIPFLSASAGNDAPAFSGIIVASPSAVVIDGSRTYAPGETILASAGPGIALTASASSDGSWLSVTTADGTPGTNTLIIHTSCNLSGLAAGTYTGFIEISGGANVTSVIVPVTLYV